METGSRCWFFFQAEDGIRDRTVTGVQTCALPISSYLDALDGRVAKLFRKTSVRGDLVDHVFDRYADVFIVSGIGFGLYCRLSVGFFAIIGILLTSYMGTQAQALGQGRRYAGLLGRADRLVLLFLGGLLQLLAAPSGGTLWG